MKRLSEALVGLAIAGATLPSMLHATNGPLQIGYGVRSQGMGGAAIAYPQDAFTAASNPAGLVTLGCRLDAGLHWTLLNGGFHTEVDIPDSSQLGETVQFQSGFYSGEDNWLPEVGLIWMINCDQALGLAIYEIGDWRLKSTDRFTALTDLGSFFIPRENLQIHSELDIYAITGSWSWQINCEHSVGLAVSAVGARLDVNVGNLLFDDDWSKESVDPRAINRGREWEWGVNARIGWLGRFCDCFALGLTYQTRTWMSRFVRYEGLIPERGQMDLTSQVGFGATWRVLPCLTVSGEAVKVFWGYGRWFENTQMRDRGLFGANNGPGLSWRDQVVLKVGAEFALSKCLLLRIGYNYGNTPLPEGALLNFLTLATIEHHLTLGGTYCFCGNQELSLVYIHGFDNHVRGDSPDLEDPFNAQLINTVRAVQNSVGVSYAYRF